MATSRDPMPARGGIAPFGYKWVDGRLVVDPTEAPVRKLIFDLFLKHRRKKTVARLLNELGHRTRSGSHFSDTTIDRLLSDRIVLGVRGSGTEQASIEPLVDTSVWETTQELLGVRPTKQTLRLFTGIVFCECGAKMMVSSGSAKYACKVCRRKISESDLEEVLHAKLADNATFGTSELFDRWYELPLRDRRMLAENICDRVVVGRDSIVMEFGYSASEAADEKAAAPQANDPYETAADEPLLSEAEAARFLSVSKMTLLRKRHTGEISFFRVGARILYSKQKHLLPYLSKNENRLQ